VRLAVGDAVVYPAHGAGYVAARGQRLLQGIEQETVVVELAGGLSVTLPVSRARERLRRVIDEEGVRRVQETLGKDVAPSVDGWLQRSKQGRAKLTGGDPLELAELVRDGDRRARGMSARGSVLSFSEKQLCEKARQRLAAEIALSRGLEAAEADAWIGDQLSAPVAAHGPAARLLAG
jgi:CarD family transcriptional regulator